MAHSSQRAQVGRAILANLLVLGVAAFSACRPRSQSSDNNANAAPSRQAATAPSVAASTPAGLSSTAPSASASAPTPLKPAGPAPAFLNGLVAGDKLGPAEVVAIGPVAGGRLAVEVHIGPNRGILEVTLRDDDAPPPVAATERYAIYWRSGGPGTNWLVDSDLGEIAVALGQRIVASEKTCPVPSGLTKFSERSKQPALGL